MVLFFPGWNNGAAKAGAGSFFRRNQKTTLIKVVFKRRRYKPQLRRQGV
jgi:hypothetical protein|tara:strand:- start:828 stop:974 length:147 start_codon:yes stop_codon:yes gene_type:complete